MTAEIAPGNDRFYPSTCPVCGAPALEVKAAPGKLEFECCRCGGFDITNNAKAVITGRNQEQRKAWLVSARQRTSPEVAVPLIDIANEP
jgi:hypothetical protein